MINGTINYTSLLLFGSVATYTCNEGYIPDDTSRARICTVNGWSGSNFTCRSKIFQFITLMMVMYVHMNDINLVLDCEELIVINGIVDYTSLLQYGSVASYTCDEGYVPDNTSITRTCTMNGWNGSEFFVEVYSLLYSIMEFRYLISISTTYLQA